MTVLFYKTIPEEVELLWRVKNPNDCDFWFELPWSSDGVEGINVGYPHRKITPFAKMVTTFEDSFIKVGDEEYALIYFRSEYGLPRYFLAAIGAKTIMIDEEQVERLCAGLEITI